MSLLQAWKGVLDSGGFVTAGWVQELKLYTFNDFEDTI
jgi:hypothetical protein